MSQLLYCKKLKKQAEALEQAPYPGALGQKIHQEISKEAWRLWLKQQTILINEGRLSMRDPEARALLKTEMQKFLFGTAGD